MNWAIIEKSQFWKQVVIKIQHFEGNESLSTKNKCSLFCYNICFVNCKTINIPGNSANTMWIVSLLMCNFVCKKHQMSTENCTHPDRATQAYMKHTYAHIPNNYQWRMFSTCYEFTRLHLVSSIQSKSDDPPSVRTNNSQIVTFLRQISVSQLHTFSRSTHIYFIYVLYIS